MANGVAFRGGTIYVAEVNPVLRYDTIEPRPDKDRDRMNSSNVMRRLTCERLASRIFDRLFHCGSANPQVARAAIISRL
jgi:hypothetical protein